MTGNNKTGGFTALEVVIGALVLSVAVGGVLMMVARMVTSAQTTRTDNSLQAFGRRTLALVQDDLQRSGFITLPGGARYPYVGMLDGEADDAFFEHHEHEAPTPPLWSDGASREIVFRIPADADGNGVPDLDGNNEAAWGDEEISYVVVPSPTGGNQLERRVDGVTDRTIARYVDRAVFDDPITSGLEIELDSIRLTIDFAKADQTGLVHRHTAETVFRLRNGGIIE